MLLLVLDGVVFLHYLDDFPLVNYGVQLLTQVAEWVTEALRRHAFVVNAKSTLHPMIRIFFFGKWLDLIAHTISLDVVLWMVASLMRVSVCMHGRAG